MKKQRVIALAMCSLLVLLFLYAGMWKLLHPVAATHDMLNQPLPRWLAYGLLWVVPVAEIVIALLLLVPRTRLRALYASLAVLGIFTGYTVLILSKSFDFIPCGCGGIIRSMSWKQHLIFNLLFMLVTLTGIVQMKNRQDEYLMGFSGCLRMTRQWLGQLLQIGKQRNPGGLFAPGMIGFYLMLFAVLGASTGAVASKLPSSCEDEPQYIKTGPSTYQLVSVDYFCLQPSPPLPTCTWYRFGGGPNDFAICQIGYYTDPDDLSGMQKK